MKSYKLNEIYSEKNLSYQKKRYQETCEKFKKYFGEKPCCAFSAPGRTEIGGNHTDHNHGCVIAAGVSLDIIAFVKPTDDGIITFKSEGYPECVVNTAEKEPVKSEINTTSALIRGVSAKFSAEGFSTGGFRAFAVSDVLQGSGLSSSAAVEVLVGTILNGLYNDGKISAVEIAQAAGFAENKFFGKASGLMDQMASSVGGFITIDFADEKNPVINPIKYDFTKTGYNLCIVDVKASHADLSDEYSAIPAEMKSVAEFFGKKVLREITKKQLLENISDVRKSCGDRAVLRALHFFDDSQRAVNEGKALENGNLDEFFRLVNESGESSMNYLQNIFPCSAPQEQGMTLGLYAANNLLDGKGAARVHGGGFGGTIQAFVPDELLDTFVSEMEKIFGENSCYVPDIRPVGGVKVSPEE